MKLQNILKAIVLLGLINITFSCSKDNDTPIVPPVVNIYRLVEDSENETKFIYDGQGRLVLETDLLGAAVRTYTYNGQNQLIDYKYYSNNGTVITETFTYNVTGQLTDKIIADAADVNSAFPKSKKEYIYTNNRITTINSFLFKTSTGLYELTSSRDPFTYNLNNQVITSTIPNLQNFVYDTNSNIIQQEGFRGRFHSINNYTFDDKINPFYNLRPVVNPNQGLVNKNCVTNKKEKNKIANSPWTDEPDVNYTYEYNDGGYPTKKTSSEGTVIYKYEKIN